MKNKMRLLGLLVESNQRTKINQLYLLLDKKKYSKEIVEQLLKINMLKLSLETIKYDQRVVATIVQKLLKLGFNDDAGILLGIIEEEDVPRYMIPAVVDRDLLALKMVYFAKMLKKQEFERCNKEYVEKYELNHVYYQHLITAYGEFRNLKELASIENLIVNTSMLNNMVKVYGSLGLVVKSAQLVENSKIDPDYITFRTIIATAADTRLLIPGLNVHSLLEVYRRNATQIEKPRLLPLTGENILNTMLYYKIPKDDLTLIAAFLHTCQFAHKSSDILAEYEILKENHIDLNYTSYVKMLHALVNLHAFQEFSRVGNALLGMGMEIQTNCLELLARGFCDGKFPDLVQSLLEYVSKRRVLITVKTLEYSIRTMLKELQKPGVDAERREWLSKCIIDWEHMCLLVHGSISDEIGELIIEFKLLINDSKGAIDAIEKIEDPSHSVCSMIWRSQSIPSEFKYTLYKKANKRLLLRMQDFESLVEIRDDLMVQEIYCDLLERSDLEITDKVKNRIESISFQNDEMSKLLSIKWDFNGT